MGNALPLFFTVITGLCLALVFYALWRSFRALSSPDVAAPGRRTAGAGDREALLNEKQSLLQGLRDLEQERDVGKVSQDDFETVNARLRARAREVIKQLDAQVAPFRAQAEALVPTNVGAQFIAPTPPAIDSSPNPACPSCQTNNESDAVFCKKCGTRIAAVAAGEPA